jgi:hypothetical protein
MIVWETRSQQLHRELKEIVQKALSSACERHLAINWLTGGGDVYSETDTST